MNILFLSLNNSNQLSKLQTALPLLHQFQKDVSPFVIVHSKMYPMLDLAYSPLHSNAQEQYFCLRIDQGS